MMDCSVEDCATMGGVQNLPALVLQRGDVVLTKDATGLTIAEAHEWALKRVACFGAEPQPKAEFVVESAAEALERLVRAMCPKEAGRVAFVSASNSITRVFHRPSLRWLTLQEPWTVEQLRLLVAPLSKVTSANLALALRGGGVQGLPVAIFYHLAKPAEQHRALTQHLASQLALQVVMLYSQEPAHFMRIAKERKSSRPPKAFHYTLNGVTYQGDEEDVGALKRWTLEQLLKAPSSSSSSSSLPSLTATMLTSEHVVVVDEEQQLADLTARGGNLVTVVLFFSESCAQCPSARLAFHRAAQTLADEQQHWIQFVETQWTGHALVRGLPSVLAWTNNRPTRYTKEKTWLDLVEWSRGFLLGQGDIDYVFPSTPN